MKYNQTALFEHDWTPTVKICFEHSISVNGSEYLVIFGRHINGGFISIPNWNICCEASDILPTAGYNAERLVQAGMDEETAVAIANYVDDEYRAIIDHRVEEQYETRYAVVRKTDGFEDVVYLAKDSEEAEKYAEANQKAYQKIRQKNPTDTSDVEFFVRPVHCKAEENRSSGVYL